ncbi:RING/U-box superfamily protein [Raphanus sativus]|nr:RING/U-box superfamily protein [Raphanus sativus]
MVLSEMCLSSSTQERLATYISKLEAIKTRSYRRGFMIEVEVRVEEDHIVQIGSGCKGKEACPSRVISDIHVARKVTGTDCTICLTELSGAGYRLVELWCSHVFHDECFLKLLEKQSSCPICRAEVTGGISFIYQLCK